ncbi:MAG: magnesium/cobalt transporter CorA [Bacteroidia bacterium]|nr:magnesium/cobalt transporter CorA [Bacteroidia bacterium]
MARKNNKKWKPDRAKKVGQRPGTMEFLGEQKTDHLEVRQIRYNELDFSEKEVKSLEKFELSDDHVLWVDVIGLHDVENIEKIGQIFGIHPLSLEDIVNTSQRPKVDFYAEYIYLVIKQIINHEPGEEMDIEQVSVIIGRNFILTFQERPGDVFEPIRDRLRKCKGKIRAMGADYLGYALLDAVVDSYYGILDSIWDTLGNLEDNLASGVGSDVLIDLKGYKRTLIDLRRALLPVREMVAAMTRHDTNLITENTRIYLQDVQDHAVQVAEGLFAIREFAGGIQDLYLSLLNNRMNEVMKVLALISTIFLPLTLVAGIYGMNFDNMPELHSQLGYPAVLVVMVGIGIGFYFFFRTRKWL